MEVFPKQSLTIHTLQVIQHNLNELKINVFFPQNLMEGQYCNWSYNLNWGNIKCRPLTILLLYFKQNYVISGYSGLSWFCCNSFLGSVLLSLRCLQYNPESILHLCDFETCSKLLYFSHLQHTKSFLRNNCSLFHHLKDAPTALQMLLDTFQGSMWRLIVPFIINSIDKHRFEPKNYLFVFRVKLHLLHSLRIRSQPSKDMQTSGI